MRAIKRKIIRLRRGDMDKLMAMHGCSKATAYNALAYIYNSDKAIAIRRDALEVFGGVETDKVIFS